MLSVNKINGKIVKVTDGEIYFICKVWQFKDKVELVDILQRSNFQLNKEDSIQMANELHENYLSKI